MPIEKDEGFRLIKGGEPFTTLVNASLDLLKNPVSIAIWVYLCSKPKDWIVRPADLMNRFEIGRYQYLQAMKELRLTGLVWDLIVNDGLGKILEKRIVCDYVPHETRHESGFPTDGSTHKSDYPTVGKSDPLLSKDLLQIKEDITNKIIIPIGVNAEAWDEWAKFRKDRKKPISIAAANKQFKLLLNYNEIIQAEIIDQSIRSDYQGLFPPKLNGRSMPISVPQRPDPDRPSEIAMKFHREMYPEQYANEVKS